MQISKLIPLLVLIIVIGAVFYFDLHLYLSFEQLKVHRESILLFVDEHYLLAILLFMALYTAVVALSIPGGAFMTITGGFLFGIFTGTLAVVTAATLGATLLFVIAKTSLGDALKSKAAPWLDKMANGFQENAFNYLLVLRLIPLFPFFVVNLVPAFLGVSIRQYILSTFIGIIPGTFVFVSVGTGLGSIFDSGDEFSTTGILTPEIIIALVGLALLSILPVLYKKFKR